MSDINLSQLTPSRTKGIVLKYDYQTEGHYQYSQTQKDQCWHIELKYVELQGSILKSSSSELFKPFAENIKTFKYSCDGREAGFLQVGLESWNNRMRIWDILVHPEFRGKQIGTQMMNHAKKEALDFGARMIVLETQSCNIPAINFYLKHGFQLIGHDSSHYSNDDAADGEIRLEFGWFLPAGVR
ncbi:MAG: GNAT family N-acetyltransferase [Bacteriovoracaceae bacterium]|jgi:ribosomal protein S18 acetylase RimI-like enzyme|nr:GNAT family N-acetyltransferase [Bacteriovoracaceae bacterium]